MKSAGFMLLILVVTACSSPQKQKPEQVDDSNSGQQPAVSSVDLVKKYADFIRTLDSANVESVSLAVKKFEELFKESNPDLCDSAFVKFQHFYEKMETTASLQVESDSVLQKVYWDEVEKTREATSDFPVLKKYEKKLLRNGYRFEIWEGNLMAGADRSFLEKHFYSMLSAPMCAFLKLCHSDDDNPFQHDAGIVISETEYVKRLIQWETFIKKKPDFIRIDRAREMYRMYFTFFLLGMDNTPAYDEVINEAGEEVLTDLDPYFKTAYTYLKKQYPNSLTYAKVKPYWKAVDEKNLDQMNQLEKSYLKQGIMIDFSKDYNLYY